MTAKRALIALGLFHGLSTAYFIIAMFGKAGRKDTNIHPILRSQVGPGWY